MQFFLLVYSLAFLLIPRRTSCELFTALVDMEELLQTEAVLMETLEGYIAVTEEKLGRLRRHLEEFRKEHEQASQGMSEYLSNPINAYLLTKRLTTNWKEVESLMTDDVGFEFVDNITNYRSENLLKFPTDEDLNGAAVALMRLQDTYKLDTSSVARGELNGVQYSTQLSAGDCFELGRQSYQNKDYYHTVLWMTEAMDRYHEEVNKTTTKGDILEYLAFSTYMQGNIRRALQMTNELLEIYPNHERARGNKIYYEDALQESKKRKRRGDDGEDIVVEKVPDGNYYKGRGMYEKLCRNEVNLSVAVRSKLFCRYVDFGKPFLKLAKLKEEEAYLDPRIVLYHDVISDREIKTIQQMATPRFKRATVQNSETGKLEIAHYRISKSAWLEDHEHPHIAAVSQRVEDITGLNMATSESLQVVNYGIGGHYEPHFDFARMSDVPQGGATVFPGIKVSLWPKKGTAAFWYNLRKNGEGDFLTRHAACPVLTGSKWVCNKWIHERGQEFRRPCGLTEDAV
ncbi:hypothetical protein RUM44_009251 [Polyplax serrata]|uniref:procollagen-proline 4-dioxygenase n=1 Tax=Polyplax serrata TaxID=468196 RepID=A0ABR1AS53_POLSC